MADIGLLSRVPEWWVAGGACRAPQTIRVTAGWLADWLAGWLAAGWLAGWLAAGWLAGWPIRFVPQLTNNEIRGTANQQQDSCHN